MQIQQNIDESDLALVMCIDDELLFALLFWGDDLTEEMSVEQKMMFLDRSTKVLACTGRKIAKTICLESRVIRYGVNHDRRGNAIAEALCFTPRESQLDPIINRIYGRINATPFLKAFTPSKGHMLRGDKPLLNFATQAMVYFRVEGISGTDANMVGLRAEQVWGDEMAFGNEVCHTSRIQTAMPDAKWWYSGVPNGWRGSPFYRLDQTNDGSEWSKHNYSTYVNPIYQGEEAHATLVKAYGGENTHGYKTQVLGKWGDEFTTSFPPGSIAIESQPYFVKTLTSHLKNTDQAVAIALGLPSVRADTFCIGWDYGFSPDPSVLKVAYTRGEAKWYCYARIMMRQVPLPMQARVVRYLYSHILLGALGGISSDDNHAIQTLAGEDESKADRFFRCSPGGTMVMVDHEGKPMMEIDSVTGQEIPVKQRIKQHLTDRFRESMINANLDLPGVQLWLGKDMDEAEELAGTTERRTDTYVVYQGPPDPDNPRGMLDHITDANRFLIDAIFRVVQSGAEDESDAALISQMGWQGQPGAWKAPWSAN